MEKSYRKCYRQFRLPAAAAAMLLLFLLAPLVASAADWYWVGDPALGWGGDWNGTNSGSAQLWAHSSPTGTRGIPGGGDTANVLQSSNAAGLTTVTYGGTTYSSGPLGTIVIKNTAAKGVFTGASPDTGVGWIMVDQKGGAMNANVIKIGPLGAYMIENGTLTVQSSLTGGLYATGTLGAAGYSTDMKSGQPYEGGLVYQTGGTVNTAAVSLGWSSLRNAPGEALYVLLGGALKVADDTGGGALAPGSPTPGAMYVGSGGSGTVFQGSGPTVPTSGAITQTTVGWTYASGPGAGGTVETGSLYLGLTHSDGTTVYYGNGYYEQLHGTLTVDTNAYIGMGGNATNASQGDFQQGYASAVQSVAGDGKTQVTVKGDLYLGPNGGSGSYELYNGALTVNGAGTHLVTGTKGGMYIGFGGSQGSGFTQGKPYQDASGTWTTSSSYLDTTGAWQPLPGGPLTNTVTTPNLYIGLTPTANDNGWPSYTLADGTLAVSGNTYVGYGGQGNFTQGQVWTDNGSSMVTPGGAFTTGNLYLGYKSGGNGQYSLAAGTLTVSDSTFVGYSGQGYVTQGQAWTGPDSSIVTAGGTVRTGSLYLGYNQGGSGQYSLVSGTLTVSGATYIGYGGYGNFTQGQMYNGDVPVVTDGGTVNTGNLYLAGGPVTGGGSVGGTTYQTTQNFYSGPAYYYTVGNSTTVFVNGAIGTYNLAAGTLNVGTATAHANTYVGYTGWGTFNQSGGTFTNTGDLVLGFASGVFQVTNGTSYTDPNNSEGTVTPQTVTGTFASTGCYNLSGGSLQVKGDTYVGYGGTGTFTQGVSRDNAGNVTDVPGSTFQTDNLYLGYLAGTPGTPTTTGTTGTPGFTAGNGNYTLANGSLTVNGATYVGYGGQGSFTQGQIWNNGTTQAANGGTFTTGSLYLGYNPGASGTYTLANGSLTTGATYVGYNGSGTFNQSGGTHTTGNLSIAGGTSGYGNYNLSGGTLSATTIVNKGTFSYSGGTVTGSLQNNGYVSVTGAPVTPNTFGASVTNNGNFNVNAANVIFAGTVTNNAGGFFGINFSNVTFGGSVFNYGSWFTDPSTITITGDFTQEGVLHASSGDTFEFTSGSHVITLGGGGTYIPTIILDPGAILILEPGTLFYTTLTNNGGTIDFNGGFLVFETAPSAVPVPAGLLLLGPGLLALTGIRRRTRK